MSDEISEIKSSPSDNSRVQSSGSAAPPKPPVQQDTRPAAGERQEQAGVKAYDDSRFSREAGQKPTDPLPRAQVETSQRFRSSLWESLDSGSGSSTRPRRESSGQNGPAEPREQGTSLPQAQNSLQDAGKALSRAASDLQSAKPQSADAQNMAGQAGDALNSAQDAAKPQGIAPPSGNTAPPDASQMQQQQMQMMMQMQQMMMQQMQMMMQMMQQMMGNMNNNGGNANNNGVNPINNNNNPINNNNNTNNNTNNTNNNTRPFGNLFNSWKQGQAGNCASIAVIKAAQEKYGQNVFNNVEQTSNGGYNVTLKDGKKVSLSADELATAKRMSRFSGSGPEVDYANLCYAVMAKNALGSRYQGANSIARSCQALNSGQDPNDTARYLGLENNIRKISTSQLNGAQAAVAWSYQHAVYISGGSTDAHGSQVRYNGTDTCGQRLNWAYVLT